MERSRMGIVALAAGLAMAAVAAWADPRLEFGGFPALGYCMGDSVRLRDEPGTGPESKIVGKVDHGDRLIVLGRTSIEGDDWFEAEHPKGAGTVWISGRYVQPVFEDQGTARAEMTTALERTFGTTPERARALFGPPKEERSERIASDGGEIVLTDLVWDGHEAGWLDGHLVSATVSSGTVPFGEVRIGDGTGDVQDALGEPESRDDGGWTYSLGEMESVAFALQDGRVTGMSYQIYYDIGE